VTTFVYVSELKEAIEEVLKKRFDWPDDDPTGTFPTARDFRLELRKKGPMPKTQILIDDDAIMVHW